MRTWWVVPLLALVLAGCTERGAPEPPGEEDETLASGHVDFDEEPLGDNQTLPQNLTLDAIPSIVIEDTMRIRFAAGSGRFIAVSSNETFRVSGLSISGNGGDRILAIWPDDESAAPAEPCGGAAAGMRFWANVWGGNPDLRDLEQDRRHILFVWSAGGDAITVSFNGAGNRASVEETETTGAAYNVTRIDPDPNGQTGTSYTAGFQVDVPVPAASLFLGGFTAGGRIQQGAPEASSDLRFDDGTTCADAATEGGGNLFQNPTVRLDAVLAPGNATWSGAATGGATFFDQSNARGLLLHATLGLPTFWMTDGTDQTDGDDDTAADDGNADPDR